MHTGDVLSRQTHSNDLRCDVGEIEVETVLLEALLLAANLAANDISQCARCLLMLWCQKECMYGK